MNPNTADTKKDGRTHSEDAEDNDTLIRALEERNLILEKELRAGQEELCARVDELRRKNDALERQVRESKRIEAALRKNEKYLESIFEGIQEGISILDKEMNIVKVNRAMEQWYSHMGPLVGKRCYRAYQSRDRPCMVCPSLRAMKEKTMQMSVVPYVNQSGVAGWMELYSFPLLDDHGNVIGVIEHVRDITARRRAEEDLKEAKAEAELYLDLMGHDIRNMNMIGMGFLEIAMGSPDIKSEDKELLLKSLGSLESSTRLIDNVRKLQKARSGELKHYEIDACTMFMRVLAHFSNMPGVKATFNYRIPPSCQVMANELLYEVFENIVGNSIKHGGPEPVIDVRFDLVTVDCRTYNRFIVEDNGPGIPDTIKGRIFNRMQRGDTLAKGMGLGLYLVKSLVESYGGRVWVEDRVPGDHTKGAKFVVMLPVT